MSIYSQTTHVLETLRQDLRFALRSLRRSPGLAATCVVTIALGVGANGAMFSLADRLFLRPPMGVADPNAVRRLYVRTKWSIGGVPTVNTLFSYQAFATLDSGLAPRVSLAAFSRPDTMPLRIGNVVRRVHG